MKFLNPLNVLYYFFYLAFTSGVFRIVSPSPYSGSFAWTNNLLNSGSNFYDSFQCIYQKVESYEVRIFKCRAYDDGTGFYRVTVTDDLNNTQPVFINYLKGDKGDTGSVGPQGPAGDPGPAGSTPDMSGVIEKLTLISDKLVSIDSNLMAVAGSASSPVDIVGVNV